MTVQILLGDVRDRLKELPDESVHCVVTSPPYWGLRDYGVAGQLGLEKTLADHIRIMVEEVFAEVWRVLRKDGTCWVNYGDCYATAPNGRSAADIKALSDDDRTFRDKPFSTIGGTLKAKDLCMMPNRFAIAMQDWGWWVRSEIIWHKPNPMPESIKDRPGTSHEKVFLFSKAEHYFYDAQAVRVPAAPSSIERWQQDIESQDGSDRANGGGRSDRPLKAVGGPRGRDTHGCHTLGDAIPANDHRSEESNASAAKRSDKQRGHSRRHAGFDDRWDQMSVDEQRANGANLRNVWTIAISGFKEAHFATFPPALPEICIKAGCPEGGTVLDPFGGAGTSGLVADRLGRNAILIELNPAYAEIARKRIAGDNPLFTAVDVQAGAA